MTAKACRGKNTLLPFTNGDISQTFDRQWAVSPRGISCHLVPSFTSSMARFVHDNINSKDVCRVFVLQCWSTSYLTSLVSSRRVHLSCTIHSYFFTSIQSYIHPYINTCTYSHIHAYNTYTQYQFIHDCVSHTESWSAASFRLTFLPFFKWLVLNNGQLEFTFFHVSSG